MENITSQERMQAWHSLPENTIAWETFKRLVNQFGIEQGIIKAHQIIKKKSRGN